MSNILTEEEIRRQIKIEVIKEAVNRSVDSQIRESVATWLAGKIPGSSEQGMQQALALVSKEEILKNLDVEQFVDSVSSDVIPRIQDQISSQVAELIAQSLSNAAAKLEQEV